MAIDLSDYYWRVAERPGQVYASKRRQLVPDSDAMFVAFLAAGNFPTPIATEAELRDVLFERGLPFKTQDAPDQFLFTREMAAALIKELAARFGVTPAALLASIKARL